VVARDHVERQFGLDDTLSRRLPARDDGYHESVKWTDPSRSFSGESLVGEGSSNSSCELVVSTVSDLRGRIRDAGHARAVVGLA
jgi:hypothetical protein